MEFLSNTNILSTGLIILLVIVLILLGLIIWMHARMKRFLINVDSHNIADSLQYVSTSLKDLQKFKEETNDHLDNMEKRLQNSIQSVHTIRFNPFHGTGEGGNQSFATAFINENGDGVVISSLYSRERVSVFSKPIKNLTSEYEMSNEEKEALNEAKQKIRNS